MTNLDDNQVTFAQWAMTAVIGLGLSLSIWWPLVQGGGLVGGDIYPYFLPQKVVFAESLAAGKLPLWDNLTGLGYPLLAESQTGVFYPPNQILYRLFDVNTAYNANVLLHYWLAFVLTWRFARCQGIGTWPAMVTALVFVYGWFPARISWEWSIFGGVFFPLSLWLTDRLVQRPTRIRFAALSTCFAVYLLSGHFTLAFISQLTAVAYAFLKVVRRDFPETTESLGRMTPVWVVGAVVASMLLAAVQVVPTYELKQSSQRTGDSQEFDPAFGHMPPLYVTQVVASWWYWHSAEVVASKKMRTSPGAIAANTNVVEAHLYWGLVPLGLILLLLKSNIRADVNRRSVRVWLVLSVAAFVYATGWLMPLTRHLPGFGFFNGPGRYTLVCALGGAVLSGHALNALLQKLSATTTFVIVLLVAGVTLPDLLWSAKYVAHAQAVPVSPLARRDDSWIRQYFSEHNADACRLLAPGPNVGNLFGVSCVPQYLGIGPAVYYDESLWPATGPENAEDEFPGPDDLENIEALAITYILTTDALQHPSAAIELVGQHPDAMLNSIWGRGGQPCFLYRLKSQPQRLVANPQGALNSWDIVRVTVNSVELTVDLSEPAVLTLKELMYPGWGVAIDDHESVPTSAGMMRAVSVAAGQHRVVWKFQPASFQWGTWSSLLSCVLLAAFVCTSPNSNHLPSKEET